MLLSVWLCRCLHTEHWPCYQSLQVLAHRTLVLLPITAGACTQNIGLATNHCRCLHTEHWPCYQSLQVLAHRTLALLPITAGACTQNIGLATNHCRCLHTEHWPCYQSPFSSYCAVIRLRFKFSVKMRRHVPYHRPRMLQTSLFACECLPALYILSTPECSKSWTEF